jgi:hypothetical protein
VCIAGFDEGVVAVVVEGEDVAVGFEVFGDGDVCLDVGEGF